MLSLTQPKLLKWGKCRLEPAIQLASTATKVGTNILTSFTVHFQRELILTYHARMARRADNRLDKFGQQVG